LLTVTSLPSGLFKKIKYLYLILFISAFSLQVSSQDYIGYFKNIDDIAGLGAVTRIELKSDSSFHYVYAFDLFYDDVIGAYHFSNDTIFLKYTPALNFTVRVIDTNYYSVDTKPAIQIMKIDTSLRVYPALSNPLRPEKLLYHKNKLIELSPELNVTHKTRKYKMEYQRVNFDQFNNSGATYLRISN
jgi:hypothetical protein